MKKVHILLTLAGLLAAAAAPARAGEVAYEHPSREIEEMVLARPLPAISFNNRMNLGVIYQAGEKYLPISEIASIREFKVGGLRLNGDNFSQTRKNTYASLELIDALTGKTKPIADLPSGLKAHGFKWSPDGRWLCFLNDTPREVELYRVDAASAAPSAVKINTRPVNSIFSEPYLFLDNDRILYKSVPRETGAFPVESSIPNGPIVISDKKHKDRYRTYQDLIKSPYDEAVFEYLCTAELSLFDGSSTKTLGKKGVIRSFDASPDGKYIILTTLHKPYSYSKTYSSFRKRVVILNDEGKTVSTLKKLKAEKGAPSGSDWCWREDKPSTLVWKEGKSCLKQCEAPFDLTEGQTLLSVEGEISAPVWANGNTAMAVVSSTKLKTRKIVSFNPSDSTVTPVVLLSEDTREFSAGAKEQEGHICKLHGRNLAAIDEKGGYVLLYGNKRLDENDLCYSYIDRISLKDGSKETIWTSGPQYRISLSGVASYSRKGMQFIATKESATEVPNYVSISVDRRGKAVQKRVSSFENTLPHSSEIRMEYFTYKRADGLDCAARVYLPASYDKDRDGKLPVFMWTYPREHYTRTSAKVNYRAAHNKFAMPDQWNQIFWCLKGYAVVLDWTMAIVAEDPNGDYNKHFVEELVMNAEAIVDALDSERIGDRERMAVGGLSYGSFMTANLLAHTDLFKCGFANCGAFNRTLTPFGFQHYKQDYWKSEQIYHDMSPFNYADKIKEPILITHGQMDENAGTHPIQSERLYYAIIGNGGTATYMQLPYEGHKMAYRENVLHYFSVVEKMLDKYLKKK